MRETVYLNEWCDKKNITQKDLARMAKLNKNHLSRIAKHQRAYTATRKIIEKALGLKERQLLTSPFAGIDLAVAIRDPNVHVGGSPLSRDMKKGLEMLLSGLQPSVKRQFY